MVRRGRSFLPRTALAGLICLLLHTPATAAPDETVGTSPAAFLEIPVGATTVVVPEIVAGMRPDGSMLFANPSVLGDVGEREFYFTTSNWLDEFNLSAATATFPLRSLGLTWSTGARLLYSGDLRGYDATGTLVAEEQYYDMAFTTGVGRRFDRIGLSVGAGATYLREHLAVEDGDGFTFSLGASYRYRQHRLDVSGQDLGGRLAFDGITYDIDSRLVVGYGYQLARQWGTVRLGTEATFTRGEFRRFDAGVSYDPNRYLTIRSGMGHATTTTAEAEIPLAAGMSVHLGALSLDYAFTPRQYFSDTHTFAVRFSFSGVGGGMPPVVPPTNRPTEVSGGNTAPVFASSPAAAPVQEPVAQSYLIVAGSHTRIESAEAEARALQLLKINAVAEKSGDRFWVVVDRFNSREEAVTALRSLRNKGHRFGIVVDRR